MSMALTVNQTKTINIACGVSSMLSLCGSSIIMYKTTRSDRKNPLKNVYQRLLFAMSFFDIFQSISSGLSTILAPRDTPIPYAFGSVITCEMMGFFMLLSYSTFFYVCALSLHYVLTIAYGMKEAREKKFVEPYMHLVCILIPLALAIGALVTDQYNFAGNRCWFGAYPFGCEDDESVECTRGLNAKKWVWLAFAISLICFFFISVCMTIVYVSVRRQEKKLQTKYNTLDERLRAGDAGDARDKKRKSFSSLFRSKKEENNPTDTQRRGSLQSSRRRSSRFSFSTTITQDSFQRHSFTAHSIPPEKQSTADLINNDTSEISDKGNFSSNVGDTADSVFVSAQAQEEKYTRQLKLEYKKSKQMSKKTKNLAIQGALYVSIFFLMIIFGYITRGIHMFKGYFLFPTLLLSSIFYSLQGFLNMFVYIRPRVLRIKQENKDFSYLKAVRMAIFETEENARRRRSSVNRFSNPKAMHIIKNVDLGKGSSGKTSVETPNEICDNASKSHSRSNAAVVGQQRKLSNNDDAELPNQDKNALYCVDYTPPDDGADVPFSHTIAKDTHEDGNNVDSNDDMYVKYENTSKKNECIDVEQHDNTTSPLYDRTANSDEEDSKPVTSTLLATCDFNESSFNENEHVNIQSINEFDICGGNMKSLEINSADNSLSLSEESDSLSGGSTKF